MVYTKLKGQWKKTPIICRLFGHAFVDPRIMRFDLPQQEWKCTRCGYEINYKLFKK